MAEMMKKFKEEINPNQAKKKSPKGQMKSF